MTMDHLEKAFGTSKTHAELLKIADQVNGRLFEIAIEFFRIPKLIDETKNPLISVNADHVWDALEKGKGAVLLVSHLCNWEILAVGGGMSGVPIHAVGRQNKNPFIEAYVQRIRGKTNLKTIHKIGAIKDVGRLLKENQVVCLPMDQRVKGGERVPFLGQDATLSSLPALLSVRYGSPVIPCFVTKNEGPTYRIYSTPAIGLLEGENLRESLRINTKVFAKRIEEEILKIPEEWILWRHNIWKD